MQLSMLGALVGYTAAVGACAFPVPIEGWSGVRERASPVRWDALQSMLLG